MKQHNHWWKNAIFYEIYLRSFQDSNGDGIGDLKGVIQRLDHFQYLGIDALWITPFFQSPHVDFGYDISDHKAIDPRYGTMDDFRELIEAAKERDLKIVVDIILNHTSDEHPYFIESRQSRESPKRDWYIWHDGKPDGNPPNNWEGFERSCWTFDEQTQQYYYHFHYQQQPDLNWRHPDVIQEMFSICDFWLSQGVAGLRLDAINYLVEDPQLRDNPIVDELPEYLRNIFQFNQLPIYTINHPDNHDLLKQLRHHTQSNHDADPLLIGEIWVPTTQDLRAFYGDNDNEIQLPFNFFLSAVPSLSAAAFRAKIKDFEATLDNVPTTVVLSNHDFARATVRYGTSENSDAIAKLLATLLLTLRGIPFIYYGEEIGMVDTPPNTIDEVQDPRGRIRWPEYKGRDGCRTPMQWDDSPNAGFTSGTPWYKTAPDYITRNVSRQTDSPNSVLNYYKTLIQFRRSHPCLTRGDLTLVGEDPNLLVYSRQYQDRSLLVLMNMSDTSGTFPLANYPETASKSWVLTLSTHTQQTPQGKRLQGLNSLVLQPYEGAIAILQ